MWRAYHHEGFVTINHLERVVVHDTEEDAIEFARTCGCGECQVYVAEFTPVAEA